MEDRKIPRGGNFFSGLIKFNVMLLYPCSLLAERKKFRSSLPGSYLGFRRLDPTLETMGDRSSTQYLIRPLILFGIPRRSGTPLWTR